jgi:hypothetical protein
MALIETINMSGAAATLGMGCLGLLAPNVASQLSGLTATGKAGFAEFRATFGGMFIAMGLIPILSGHPMAYFMAGTIWLGAAFGRIVSVVVDRGHSDPNNFIGIAVEAIFGILMLVGSPFLRLSGPG